MSLVTGDDWNPGTYERFRGLRLRPALDLLAQVPDLPPGDVVDLGCGAGAVGAALRARFAQRRLLGVDASPAMLERAQALGTFDALAKGDIATWVPASPTALIFSNAALHWLGDHERLLPRLASVLAPGGVLAVQMPRNFDAASHRLLHETFTRCFPGRIEARPAPVKLARDYVSLLRPHGQVEGWETEYVHHLVAVPIGHPVRAFTESTAMRPFLAQLSDAEATQFTEAYDTALTKAYSPEADGSVLFPFRRVFLIVRRP